MAKIVYQQMDITTVTRGFIVHGCNTESAMGSGVAIALRNKFPMIYGPYRVRCETAKLHPNYKQALLGTIVPVSINDELIVVNMITQTLDPVHRRVSYDAVVEGFQALDALIDDMGADELPIYMPKIGAGLGGGSWPVIKAIVEEHFSDYGKGLRASR